MPSFINLGEGRGDTQYARRINQSRGNEITNARHHQAQIKKWRGNVDFCHFLNNNIFKLFLIFEFCFHKTSMNIVVSTQSQQQVKSTQHTQHTCTKDRKSFDIHFQQYLSKKSKNKSNYIYDVQQSTQQHETTTTPTTKDNASQPQ